MSSLKRNYQPSPEEIIKTAEYCKSVFFGKPEKLYPPHMELLKTITNTWKMEAIVMVCHSVLIWSLENCCIPPNACYYERFHSPKYNNFWRGKFLNCAEKILGIEAPFGAEWEAQTNLLNGDSGAYETFYPNALIKEFNGFEFWIDALLNFAIRVFLNNDWQGHKHIFKSIFFNLGLQSPFPIIQLKQPL